MMLCNTDVPPIGSVQEQTNLKDLFDKLPPCMTDVAVHKGLCNSHAARLVSTRSSLCWQEICRAP